jgi:hypothetical protein
MVALALNQDFPRLESISVLLEVVEVQQREWLLVETEGVVAVAARLRRRRADLLELALYLV